MDLFATFKAYEHFKCGCDKEDFDNENYQGKGQKQGQKQGQQLTTNQLISLVIGLAISVYSAWLAYQCNKNEKSNFNTALVVLFAFFLSSLYLVFYFFKHVLFGDKCP